MPKFQPRRGLAAIEKAAAPKGGGGSRSFVPEIKLRADGETKYLLVLTPIDEVATLLYHEWIPVGKGEKANGETYNRYEAFLSRKDPMLGEDYDEIEDRLDTRPKERCYGVVVELEPVLETVRGRQRPKGFTVKTEDYTRRGEDGEKTVTQPVMGLMIQSAALVWSPLGSLDESQGPLEVLPLQMTRRGTDRNTRYDFVPFVDIPVDLSPIIEHFDGLSFLSDVKDDVEAAIAAADDEIKAAQAVASFLYDKRLEELADKDRYDELVGPITEIPKKFGSDKKGGSKPAARPERPSPRPQAAAPAEPEATVEEAPAESREDKFAALKARIEAKKG